MYDNRTNKEAFKKKIPPGGMDVFLLQILCVVR